MKTNNINTNTSTWSDIKDRVYGRIGSERRDNLEQEMESLRIGLLLKKAKESKT